MADYVCNSHDMIVAADGVAAAAVSTDSAATAELQTADATTAAAEINAAAPLPLLTLMLPLPLLRLLLPLPLLALHVGLTHFGILLNAVHVVVTSQYHHTVVRLPRGCVLLHMGRHPGREIRAAGHGAMKPDHKTTPTLRQTMRRALAMMLMVTDYRTIFTSLAALQLVQLASIRRLM